MEGWERDDLVATFVATISQATPEVQKRMVWHFYLVEDELGRRVGDGLGIALGDVRDLPPLRTSSSPTRSRSGWRAWATTAPATSRATR